MSKAFTKEDEAETLPRLPSRAPLPVGVPNYVTARGIERLERELRALQAEIATLTLESPSESRQRALVVLNHRRAMLESRLASAEVVNPSQHKGDLVRFGASVTLRASTGGQEGLRRIGIVGVDEADASLGLLAFVSPLAKALLGRSVGETVVVRLPRGSETWEIVAITWDD